MTNTKVPASPEQVSHTPGPWKAKRDSANEEYEIGVPIFRGVMRLVATVSYGYSEPAESEQHANARLIAAAPDLLALARTFLSECAECQGKGVSDDTHEDCESCMDVRAVIKKATQP